MTNRRNGAAPGRGNQGQAQQNIEGATLDDDSIRHNAANVRCTICGHPLTAPKSVARERGPICAARKGVHE